MSTTPTVKITYGPNGLGHALGSVRKMAALAGEAAHTYELRSLATRITRDVASKDKLGELQALYRWVRDNIRYRHDPRGLEWIQAPSRTLSERAGDCDDIALLLSALAQSIGFETRYRTVGPTRGDQRHVSMEARCEGAWVSLDPVLEPPRKSTAPSSALGAFGQRAPGAAIYYDSETGQPMSTLRGTSSGALWPQTPLERGYASAPVGPTVYRSAGAAGGGDYRSLRPLWHNALDPSDLGAHEDETAPWFWQASEAQRQGRRVDDARARDAWWRSLGSEQRQRSRATYLAIMAEAPAQLSDQGKLNWWSRLSSNTRQRLRKKYAGYGGGIIDSIVDTAASVAQVVPVVGTTVAAGINIARGQGAFSDPVKAAAHALGPSGFAIAPFVSSQGLRLNAGAVREAVTSNVQLLTAAARSGAVRQVSSASIPAGARPIAQIVRTAREGAPSARDVAAMLRARAPGPLAMMRGRAAPMNVRQAWGFTRPLLGGLSLNWALSGAAESSAAAAAVSAVQTFISRNGRPPQIAIAAVRTMQSTIAGLVVDGLWGNNSRAAAAWALGKPASSLPGVAAPWSGKPVTWTPPAAAAPAPVVVAPAPAPTPAPAPQKPKPTTTTSSKPKPQTYTQAELDQMTAGRTPPGPAPRPQPASAAPTRRTLAKAAVDAVNRFRKANGGRSPQIALGPVYTYQQAAHLVPDGLWGNMTRAAAATDLGVNANTLPPVAVRSKPASSTATVTTARPLPPPAPTPPVKPTSSSSAATKPQTITVGPAVITSSSPTPASSTASERKKLARAAVNAVRAFIEKKGKPPQIAVKAVRDYQVKAWPLTGDGLWGDATRASAAADLGVKVSTLPAVAAPFKRKPTAVTPVSVPTGATVTPVTPAPVQPVQSSGGSSGPVNVTTGPVNVVAPAPAPPSPDERGSAVAPVTESKPASNVQGVLIALAIALAMRRRKRAA